jgi:molybdopterin molybdotransferase
MTKELISIDQAQQLLQAHPLVIGKVRVPLSEALGRVTSADWHCDRDQPPFDRVMMDGIAIRHEDYASGKREWEIAGLQAAGSPIFVFPDPTKAIEIMTGAAIPLNLDTVIPYEQITLVGSMAQFIGSEVVIGQHVHRQGRDAKKGDTALAANSHVGPAEIGIAASLGLQEIEVCALPRILIVSTGDELVDLKVNPMPHQMRRSNVYALASAVKNAIGVRADLAHLKDNLTDVKEFLAASILNYDVIILSGAVSMGKLDFVSVALLELGCTIPFHGIAQKPGKPMLFATHSDCRIFGLPGNPVSTLVCWARYVRPYLTGQMPQKAMLTNAFSNKGRLTLFAPARSLQIGNQIEARLLPTNGSGDYLALAGANGFIECPSAEELKSNPFAFWPI